MIIKLIGINHKTAPIEVREQFYLNELQQDLLLSELKCSPLIVEAFVLSTCNRTEVCVHTISETFTAIDIINKIKEIKKIDSQLNFDSYFYSLKDRFAIEHLLRVSAGLDSLVVGEKQIIGQIKASLKKAADKGFLSKSFNLLSQVLIRAGKRVRTETQIGVGGSSISWAAIAAAEKLLGTLENKTVLIIGAGKMSELAVGTIFNKGFKDLFLMNRTLENAQLISKKYGGKAVSFCDIKELFPQVDLCICSTDAPHYVIDFEVIEKIANPDRKCVMIDISMPRNIDPRISSIPHIDLIHIDDLRKHIAQNLEKRIRAIKDVEAILADKLVEFYFKLDKMQANDLKVPNSVDVSKISI